MDNPIIDPQSIAAVAQFTELGTQYLLNIVAAIAILIGGLVFSNWAQRRVLAGLAKIPNFDDTLEPFIAKLVKYSILILVVVAVLARFGVQTTSIIAILGAAGLAIGLALQGMLANIAAGVMLLFLRPFKLGDYIAAGAVSGEVTEIGLFSTELKDADGIFVVAPNNQIWSSTITNYTRNPIRRVRIIIGIGYDDDIDQASGILEKMASDDDRVLEDKGVTTFVSSLGDSAVILELRVWVNRTDYGNVLRDFTKQAKLAFDKAGISLPYPQRDVHIFEETED
jgi:small conductance mechanosensitive channel